MDRIVDALGPDVLVVLISGGSTILMKAFCEYLGSECRQKLIDYPGFDLPLFRRCLQQTDSSVFGNLDVLTVTEFMFNRLKSTETQDWMSFRPALRKAVLTNDLGMPHLVVIVTNIIDVRPLIFPYLKKKGSKDDGDSFVARASCFNRVSSFPYLRLLCL